MSENQYQLETEQDMQDLIRRMDQITEAIPGEFGAFLVKEKCLVPLSVNAALTDLLGYTKEEYMHTFADDVMETVCREDVSNLREKLQNVAHSGKRAQGKFCLRTKAGRKSWIQFSLQKVGRYQKNPIIYTLLCDINQQVQNEKKAQEAYQLMHYRAVHDPLTGICNRDNFYTKVRKILDGKPQEQYVLVRWNIERFKVINDLFGVETGDQILKDMAAFFKETFRDDGVYARLESDHFVLFYPERFISLEKLIEDADRKFKNYQKNYSALCNLGVYKVEDQSTPVNQMCDRANLALQTIKGSYIRRYAYYDTTLRNHMIEEQQIIDGVEQALREGEFKVFVQPIYGVLTNTPESGEALVRWQHPQKGLLSPRTFIPLFEQNGFIMKLDYYVWEKTCENLHYCMEKGLPVVPISVNVSRMNLYNTNLPEELMALTDKYQVPNSMLKLEITESAYMDNPQQLIEITERLRSYGFRILMNDFGSGYSSLNMLKELPVDTLKIDMRFINDLDKSKRAGSVITSVVRMARWLDMNIVAEGVETKTQLEFLRTIGCECVQGFFFAKPMPIEAFNQLLCKNKPAQLKDDLSRMLEHFDFDAIWTNKNISILFNGLVQGMAFYQMEKGRLTLLRANDGFYEMLGENAAQMQQASPFSKIVDQDEIFLVKGCVRAQQSGKMESVVFRRLHRDGHLMWIDCKIRFMGYRESGTIFYFAMNESGESMHPAYHMNDNVTQLQELLADEENIVECARTLSGIHDEDMAINQVLERILYYYQAERSYIFEFDWEKGKAPNTYERCAPGIDPEIQNLQDVDVEAITFWIDQFAKQSYVYIPCVDDLKETRPAEWEYLKPQNIQSLMAVPFYNDKTIRGFIGVDNPAIECDKPHFLINLTYFISNEIEKRMMNKQLHHLSYHDELTGLYNRNRYLIYEENFHRTFQRKGVGMIFLDVNGLKQINDSFGHKCGDERIIAIADMLKQVFENDMLFRLSGDEFLVACNDRSEEEFAQDVKKLRELNEMDGEAIASIGSVWKKNPESIEQLTNLADHQMYLQKKSYYESRDRRAQRESE
ncbi:MAG: EAL domain-containing protein [Hespellia sp.]|nr:EAL domain-containing protein [Hespellia sp.]